jgi:hypothetical protein
VQVCECVLASMGSVCEYALDMCVAVNHFLLSYILGFLKTYFLLAYNIWTGDAL